MGGRRTRRRHLLQLHQVRKDHLQGEGLGHDMSEPRLEDDVAAGLDERCEDCGERACVCSDFDTLEEKYAD